jgi:hypothetical protein
MATAIIAEIGARRQMVGLKALYAVRDPTVITVPVVIAVVSRGQRGGSKAPAPVGPIVTIAIDRITISITRVAMTVTMTVPLAAVSITIPVPIATLSGGIGIPACPDTAISIAA